MHIDYVAVAAGYGAKAYRIHNCEELLFDLEDAKKQTISTVFDIKVLLKR